MLNPIILKACCYCCFLTLLPTTHVISETLPGVKGFSAQWNRWEHPVHFSFGLCHCRRLCIFRQMLPFGCLCSPCLLFPAAAVPGNVKLFHICIKILTEGFGTCSGACQESVGKPEVLGRPWVLCIEQRLAWSFLTAGAAHAQVCQSVSSDRTQNTQRSGKMYKKG